MARLQLHLGVILERREPVSRWAEAGYVPVAVLADAPGAAPGSRLPGEGGRVYAGGHELMLHSGETGHYRDNLHAARPSVWVALLLPAREPRVVALTGNPYEGEALAGDEGLLVEAVAMPGPVAARIAAFVAEHHVEQVFVKRKRKPADPEAMARRVPGQRL